MENMRKAYISINNALSNLMEANTILNSDMPVSDKINGLLNIHIKPNEFYSDYHLALDYIKSNNKNTEILKQLSEVASSVDKIMHNSYNEKYMVDYYKKYYNNNPLEAVKIVLGFIEADKLDTIQSYIYSNLLSKSQFNCAIRAVKSVDPFIYDKYLDKLSEMEYTKYDLNVYKLNEIATGIKTGYLSDGTKFDQIQFWKYAPFKYSKGIIKDFEYFRAKNPNIGYIGTDNFYRRIAAFAKGALPDKADIILDYMDKNRLYAYTYISFANYKRLHADKAINYGLRVCMSNIDSENLFSTAYGKYDSRKIFESSIINEDIQGKILKEILDNNLPHLAEVYFLLEKKYVDQYNEEHKDEIREKFRLLEEQIKIEEAKKEENKPVAKVNSRAAAIMQRRNSAK